MMSEGRAQEDSQASTTENPLSGSSSTTGTVEFATWSPSDVSRFGRIVHYKGFAARINFDDEDTQEQKRSAIEFFIKAKPDTVAFDGDNFMADSFTALLHDIYNATHPQLVMFCLDTPGEKERVMASWGPIGLPFVCFPFSAADGAQLHWDQLGIEALRLTQGKTVFCFGGGDVIKREFQAASDDVTFVVANAYRDGRNPEDGRDRCSLIDVLESADKPANLQLVSDFMSA